MSQASAYQQFPLVTPIIRLITHGAAPFVALILVALVALVAALVTFGPVVLTLVATALVPVVFGLLLAVAGH